MTSRAQCRVLFHQGLVRHWGGDQSATDPCVVDQGLLELDASRDILRVQAVKAIDSIAGTFEVVLSYDPRNLARQLGLTAPQAPAWSRILMPGHEVSIAFSRGVALPVGVYPRPDIFVPGRDPLIPWMVGFIDTIEESTTIVNERVQHAVIVRGRDYGRMLQMHELQWQLTTQWVLGDEEAKARIERGLFHLGSPRAMVLRVMEVLIDKLEYPDAITRIIFKPEQTPAPLLEAIDIDPITGIPCLDPRCAKPDDFGFYQPTQLWDLGRFANFLERFADPQFVELYTDTAPDGVFRLYLRGVPYRRDDWEALPGLTVPDAEVVGRQLARNDMERVNLTMAYSPWLNSANQDTAFWDLRCVRWDRWSYENGSTHHGLRRIINNSPYNCPVPADWVQVPEGGALRDFGGLHDLLHDADENARNAAGTGDVIAFIKKRVEQLWTFYSQQHRLLTGRVIIKGDPFWRVGYRWQEQADDGTTFSGTSDARRWGYVKTVVQDYQVGGRYLTHLGIERACPLGLLPGESLPTDGTEWNESEWTQARQDAAWAKVQL